jgi:group II intron reverse transcriptase/maturase
MTLLFETESKTVPITKEMVRNAYKKVKSNQGSAGVDRESLEMYQANLLKNLYQLWNRLSSGSYFPQPVREVEIPKATGGKRKLGIPTVSDRIAQEVLRSYLEPRLESQFHEHSYGYRPLKSAHQAVLQVQENVRKYAWVIDMDIKSFFDEVDHVLLMKALDKHVEEKWVKMYIKRWLECPSQSADGTLTTKEGKGTPQGGVISPLLSNLYLHYTLDKWLELKYPHIAFVRYADDVVLHCRDESEAIALLERIRERLEGCKLRLSESKTKLVYCKDYRRREKKDYGNKFGFLGFDFKPKVYKSKRPGKLTFLGFGCEIGQNAKTRITEGWKKLKWHKQSALPIQDIANKINSQMRGVIRYFGKINSIGLHKLIRSLHFRLAKWALNKYKRFKRSYRRAFVWLKEIKRSFPNLFYHWTVYNWI